ncbi:hypothetical protein N7533_007980 [Penicillium manginii]|uniref:uncharacterized protein n=1 Tax=Penicillium manginii TaxID=203109 RepID=UPI002547BFF6|nr:uncharacterized protein N7533_007980 [Penicillium manginii]KAJ5750952.1 hypothetical protein N7533_007980 [Penicillium manginii]
MLLVSQEQTDIALAFSASNALDTSRMLLNAERSDQRGMSIENRLVILEDHLKQMRMENTRNKAQPVLTPGLLRSALEHQQILDGESHNHGITIISQRNRGRKKCSCRTTYFWGERNAGLASTSGCELHTESKNVVDILYRRIFCRWALRVSLEISYSSTFGAGGFSISPKLEFRAIVPKESQIFICLHTAEESLKSRDVSTVIQNTYNALIEAFCAGEASMTDTLQSGDGILHIVTAWQRYSSHWDSRSRLVWRLFIQNLLQAGLSPDLVNYRGETPADNMIDNFGHESNDMEKQQITIDICSDLLQAGGVYDPAIP